MDRDIQNELYKIITLKNVDNEDFIFEVDKIPYLLRTGEIRNFPKFMAQLAVKHLIDKILEKRDREGKLMTNQKMRDELVSQIVINEENFEQPKIPTTQEIVEQINQPSDIDRMLERNKERLKGAEPVIPPSEPDLSAIGVAVPPVIPQSTAGVAIPNVPVVEPTQAGAAVIPSVESKPVSVPVAQIKSPETPKTAKDTTPVETEHFAGLQKPTREEMMTYAKNTLKLDIEDKKTKAAFAKMSDDELYEELQIGK